MASQRLQELRPTTPVKHESKSALPMKHGFASKPLTPAAQISNSSPKSPESQMPLDPSTRSAMQAGFGFDFSRVRINLGEEAGNNLLPTGHAASTEGETIQFAPGRYAPETPDGRHLLSHELAHVVQQRQGLARTMDFTGRGTLEADAQQSAEIVAAGGKVQPPPRLGPSRTAVQAFDPEYHEQATIGGLTGIFTPREIGKVYEGNWKRDFSQGSTLIGQLVLVWKELRDRAAATGKVDSGLQWELMKVIAHPPQDFIGETYGGYQYFEHMDNPGAAGVAEADSRWGTGPGDIAGYIRDSRANIKDLLATSIRTARYSWGGSTPDSGRTKADAWSKGKPPADYDMWNAYKGRTQPPQGLGVPKNLADPAHSSTIVAKEVEAIATREPGAIGDPTAATAGFSADPSIADGLGRASHLIEDFFAHSNFVELAQNITAGGGPISPSALKTGTFDTPDKLHSLSGKLRDAAADMRAHMDLIPLLGESAVDTLESVADAAEAASKKLGPSLGSHTKLAKDSPHAKNFAMAHRLATAADQMVFFWVHRIMQETPEAKANKDMYVLFELIDAIVTVPSDHHPLKNVFGTPNP
jgi:hypothetical protein